MAMNIDAEILFLIRRDDRPLRGEIIMIRIHCHDVFELSDMPNPSQLLDFLRNNRRFITKRLNTGT